MNELGNAIGEICKILLPIREEFYLGNRNSDIAICTLSSITLLRNIANSKILDRVYIVGRLLSENKGIDSIIKYVNDNTNIKTIIICGKEVVGHRAGHSLLQLYHNGISYNGKILGSTSPDPYLTVSQKQVNYFQNKIKLVDMINQTNLDLIRQKI